MKETQDFSFIRQLFSIYSAFIRFDVNNLYQAYVAQRKTVHIEAQNGTTRYRILSFETFTPESGHWVIKTQCASILKEVDFGNLLNSIPVVEDNFFNQKRNTWCETFEFHTASCQQCRNKGITKAELSVC